VAGQGNRPDQSQGVQLATVQKLARYWATDYNWRKVEATLNALPQFTTEIDGVDIHFIHVRSKLPNALPVIVTHGWPGSIIEQLKIIDPLTNPTAHGGDVSDAFDVVIPSLPGYGFSGKPAGTGWDPIRVARAWIVLMKRLGYTRYVAQGGDWGNAVTEQMALLAPPELIGIHTNMPATVPPGIHAAALAGAPAPAGLSTEEQHAYDQLAYFSARSRLANEMANRPQTLYGIADSPVGLSADARSRRTESGAHHARIRWKVRGPDARRRAGQRYALLADQHGGVVCPFVLGKQAAVFCSEGHRNPGRRQRLS
jgi:pimeloyl-ACP methyl ester carboxylesterase